MIARWPDLSTNLDQNYQPDRATAEPRAAVAAVFRPTGGGGDQTKRGAQTSSELLFIQRAINDSDPWSGQMAFPGGREEPDDRSPRHTAMRETAEEIGLDLTGARFLGALTELDGGRATNRPIIVSAHAWWLEGPRPELRPNYEVAEVIWVALSDLVDADRRIDYRYPRSGTVFPGIQLDRPDQVVWGLTLRFINDLFRRLDHPYVGS